MTDNGIQHIDIDVFNDTNANKPLVFTVSRISDIISNPYQYDVAVERFFIPSDQITPYKSSTANTNDSALLDNETIGIMDPFVFTYQNTFTDPYRYVEYPMVIVQGLLNDGFKSRDDIVDAINRAIMRAFVARALQPVYPPDHLHYSNGSSINLFGRNFEGPYMQDSSVTESYYFDKTSSPALKKSINISVDYPAQRVNGDMEPPAPAINFRPNRIMGIEVGLRIFASSVPGSSHFDLNRIPKFTLTLQLINYALVTGETVLASVVLATMFNPFQEFYGTFADWGKLPYSRGASQSNLFFRPLQSFQTIYNLGVPLDDLIESKYWRLVLDPGDDFINDQINLNLSSKYNFSATFNIRVAYTNYYGAYKDIPVFPPFFSIDKESENQNDKIVLHYSPSLAYHNIQLVMTQKLANFLGVGAVPIDVDGYDGLYKVPYPAQFQVLDPTNMTCSLTMIQHETTVAKQSHDLYKLYFETTIPLVEEIVGGDYRTTSRILTDYIMTEYDNEYYYYDVSTYPLRRYRITTDSNFSTFNFAVKLLRKDGTSEFVAISPGKRANLKLAFIPRSVGTYRQVQAEAF
jgi:hypothetical protein